MPKPAREQGLNAQRTDQTLSNAPASAMNILMLLDDYGFETYEENRFPIAYLLTFRTYGTWHHGDDRTSVRRNGNNIFGGPRITPSIPLKEQMEELQKEPSFLLDASQRKCAEAAIIEVCEFRKYLSRAAFSPRSTKTSAVRL